MRRSIKRPGKSNLSGHENDLEEYFAEFEDEEPNAPQPNHPSIGLSDAEEFRRLTAYVAHLREEIARFQQPQPPSKRPLPNSVRAIFAVTVMVGFASVLGIIARRLSRLG
ncbi:hypothetical protein [Pararhizobium sp. PWRC1-1]|uniref:hypothetical protein n=1 Tax=Pararhizobium sp. PWRC1-1 TaxID=2804566 RepID=UPI003CEF957E